MATWMSKTKRKRIELNKTELEKAAGQGLSGAQSALDVYRKFEQEGKHPRAFHYSPGGDYWATED